MAPVRSQKKNGRATTVGRLMWLTVQLVLVAFIFVRHAAERRLIEKQLCASHVMQNEKNNFVSGAPPQANLRAIQPKTEEKPDEPESALTMLHKQRLARIEHLRNLPAPTVRPRKPLERNPLGNFGGQAMSQATRVESNNAFAPGGGFATSRNDYYMQKQKKRPLELDPGQGDLGAESRAFDSIMGLGDSIMGLGGGGTGAKPDVEPMDPAMNFPNRISNHNEPAVEQDPLDYGDGQVVVPQNPWDHSKTLPSWLKDYFAWAAQERADLTEENWESKKFLLLQCLATDKHCGGASDRLKTMPIMLLVAARSQRLFLIRWSRPAKLEEFLVPPPGGYDWTVPDWLHDKFALDETRSKYFVMPEKLIAGAMDPNLTLASTRMQRTDGGESYYDQETGSTHAYESIFHDVFRIMFEPSPPIAAILADAMKKVNLVPGEYAVAHYRALYGHHAPSVEEIVSQTINAVNCASQLRPGGPIYFASDSGVARRTAQKYAQETGRIIATIEGEEKPLHLDQALDWETRPVSDFYSTFIDLYLMGEGRCVLQSAGGFGEFALLISWDPLCKSKLTKEKCEWAGA